MSKRDKNQAINSKIRFSVTAILAATLGLLLSNLAIAHETDHETIKVHGDWVVTVTNPDGSIAQERSFQNALVAPGLLVGLLIGKQEIFRADGVWFDVNTNVSTGYRDWYIDVTATGVNNVQECNDLLTQTSFVNPGEPSATVTAVTASSFTLSRTLTLPLNCVTGASYTINGVDTTAIGESFFNDNKHPTVAKFTEKTLGSPISGILPDQVVTLKATISFQ